MLPREGYLKAVKRVLSYIKTFPKGRIIVDTSYPDHSMYPIEDHPNLKDFYPDKIFSLWFGVSCSKDRNQTHT
jgi:hypothetical protein